ncbi:hypothetical protein [Caulobacter sp. B11]|uniref:hypothetical protein n=1 Tax=Caulobacter sp. B11 TaxID=2048899 RepID=UPI0013747F72|nr:hypothetical protein [Caulobacter sp. B11]
MVGVPGGDPALDILKRNAAIAQGLIGDPRNPIPMGVAIVETPVLPEHQIKTFGGEGFDALSRASARDLSRFASAASIVRVRSPSAIRE